MLISRTEPMPSPGLPRRGGFTLVEILVVVVMLGVLAGVVIPQFNGVTNEARAGNVVTQLKTLRTHIELYSIRNNENPDLVATQWDELVSTGLIHDAPVNPVNRSTLVSDTYADGVGWIYDQESGTLLAALFNEDYLSDGTEDPWSEDWDE